MVADSGTPVGAHALRTLGAPNPLAVQAGPDGRPLRVQRRQWGAARPVQTVQDAWRIDDEWWRERPVSRCYYTVCLEDGSVLTLYHDLVTGAWFEQRG